MRYLTLYEAFESQKLSKTLKYIESGDKEKVISFLRKICEKIDFPFSQLSDDYIEYLPFRKALYKNDMIGDEPCEATSENEFSDNGIAGEKCTNGKIKRLWGGRQREVVCPICGGTGIKPKKLLTEPKLIKFWFTKEGRFITTTAVDGLIRNNMKNTKTLSRDLSKFDILPKRLTIREIKNLQSGQPVFLETRNGESGVGYIFQANRRTYIMQDFFDGREPYWTRRENWEKYGRFSHEINSTTDYSSVKLLTLKKDPENADPYTWNVGIENSRWDFGKIDPKVNVEDSIKDANFALVLDFGKIKMSGFNTKSQISAERSETRQGALALEKDADIKKANIKRYMDQLAKSVDVVSDISNVSKLVKRCLGGKNLLFMIMNSSRFTNSLSDIIELYHSVMTSSEKDKAYYIDSLETKIRNLLNNSSTKSQKISSNLEQIKQKCLSEGKDDYAKLIDKLYEFSQHLFERISSSPIESIDDLEVVRYKISSLRSLFDTSRYKLNQFRHVAEYLDRDDITQSYRYLTSAHWSSDNLHNPEEIINNLPLIRNLSDKLI